MQALALLLATASLAATMPGAPIIERDLNEYFNCTAVQPNPKPDEYLYCSRIVSAFAHYCCDVFTFTQPSDANAFAGPAKGAAKWGDPRINACNCISVTTQLPIDDKNAMQQYGSYGGN